MGSRSTLPRRRRPSSTGTWSGGVGPERRQRLAAATSASELDGHLVRQGASVRERRQRLGALLDADGPAADDSAFLVRALAR
ncbi:hypothetical protein ACIGYR_10910 [Streptomyces sp. NPDC053076]|uniref:hypothetical protein n=1 Tax=Streptomyces sp. NPDC053076 TaxID=3365696 RepID=UPI0037D218FC